jgi:hypothetical protein
MSNHKHKDAWQQQQQLSGTTKDWASLYNRHVRQLTSSLVAPQHMKGNLMPNAAHIRAHLAQGCTVTASHQMLIMMCLNESDQRYRKV